MIPPNQHYGEVESQQAHSVIVAVPVRFSTQGHSYKTAPPAAKLQGVIRPLVEGPDWNARPTCGRAIGGRQF